MVSPVKQYKKYLFIHIYVSTSAPSERPPTRQRSHPGCSGRARCSGRHYFDDSSHGIVRIFSLDVVLRIRTLYLLTFPLRNFIFSKLMGSLFAFAIFIAFFVALGGFYVRWSHFGRWGDVDP